MMGRKPLTWLLVAAVLVGVALGANTDNQGVMDTMQQQNEQAHNDAATAKANAASSSTSSGSTAQQSGGALSSTSSDDSSTSTTPVQLGCSELGPQFKELFDSVSSSVSVPSTVLMAGRALAVSNARGQEEVGRKIDDLARKQTNTPNCLSTQYAPMTDAANLVKAVSTASGVSIDALLERMADTRKRMTLYRDLKKDGTLNSRTLEDFREMLGVSGEMPYEVFRRRMIDHKAETESRLAALKRGAEAHESGLKTLLSKSNTDRLTLDRIGQHIASTRSGVEDSMSNEKQLTDEQTRVDEALKVSEGAVKEWGQRVGSVEAKEAHDYDTAQKGLRDALSTLEHSQSADFQRMSNWTLAQKEILEQSNKALKDEISKPLNRAKVEIEDFRASKKVLEENMDRDLTTLQNHFTEETNRLVEEIDELVDNYMQSTEQEIQMKVNKELADARHNLLMMAQRQMGSQEIELGTMRDEIMDLRKEAWDLTHSASGMERQASNQEEEWNQYKLRLQQDWARGNSQLQDRERKLGGDLGQQSTQLNSAQAALAQKLEMSAKEIEKSFKQKVTGISENLDNEASAMKEGTEFKLTEVSRELDKDKDEMSDLRSAVGQALQSNSKMVDSYRDNSNKINGELDELSEELEKAHAQQPTAADVRQKKEAEADRSDAECSKLAKAIAEDQSPKEAVKAAQAALATQAVLGLKSDLCAKQHHDSKTSQLELVENKPSFSF